MMIIKQIDQVITINLKLIENNQIFRISSIHSRIYLTA
jgi:hypothetical protein